jgi:UMF1 family MFS transporter
MSQASRKVVNAWCLYDWANSAYNLVITTTIFPTYFEAVTRNPGTGNHVRFLGMNFINTALYNYSLGAAFIVVAIISPILTSIADTRGNKKNFMRFFCFLGCITCAGLYFFTPTQSASGIITLSSDALHIGIFCMVVSCIGFWSSLVFYNSYLPDLVPEAQRDRISARGFIWGYTGSVLLQVICFVIVFFPEWFGLNSEFEKSYMPARISFVLVAIWWLGFATISFRYLPKGNISIANNKNNVFKTGFLELKKVWQQVKHLPVLKRFLYSFFWYSAGIQTVFLASAQFGAKELHLSTVNLIVTMMLIQLLAIPGAIIISRLSERFGNIQTLIGVVMIWVAICVAAYFITTDIEFYVIGGIVGLIMGGIQSLSRSAYANMMPETQDTASFFSFYDVTEKIALVLGMFSFAYVEELTGSMRNSVLALITFFAIGLLCLLWTLAIKKRNAAPVGINS